MTEYIEGSVVNGTQSLVTMNEKDERKSERTFNLYISENWSELEYSTYSTRSTTKS